MGEQRAKVLDVEPSKLIRGRRRHLRAPFRTKISFTDGREIRRGFSTNISESGMFIETLDIFPVGTELTLSFTLEPKGKVIKAQARVVHSNDAPSAIQEMAPGLGVYFTDIKRGDQDLIGDYVLRTKDTYQKLATLVESKTIDRKRVDELLKTTPIRHYDDLDELKLKVLVGWRSMEF